MTHIICPHCGKVANVNVYGTEVRSYEAVLNLGFTEDEVIEELATGDPYVHPDDGGVLEDYEMVEQSTEDYEFRCSHCGKILTDTDVFKGALAYMVKQEALYENSAPGA